MTISYPSNVRNWRSVPPVNSGQNDFTNKGGVRISLPIYLDITTSQRKEILNACRELNKSQAIHSAPNSISGITTSTASGAIADIEAYIGMTLDVLRGVIFQRGGIEAGLLLRLQAVTGIEYVTEKDFTDAFKARQAFVKNYIKDYPYEQPDTSS